MGEDEDSVALYNRVQSMGDCDHSRVLELRLNERLDFLLSDEIDVRSGLIKHDNLVLSEDGTADTDQLSLAS